MLIRQIIRKKEYLMGTNHLQGHFSVNGRIIWSTLTALQKKHLHVKYFVATSHDHTSSQHVICVLEKEKDEN